MQDFLSLVTLFLASANAVGAHVPVLNNVYQGQTVFEHKHQRNFVAPSGSSVVKQVIASVTSGKPAYSTSVGAATTSVAKRSEPTELPVQRRDDVRPARKMERRQTSGVMQNIVYATTLSTPNATSTAYAGAASQSPVLQYLPHQDAELEYFNPSGFNNAINSTLSTAYPVYNGTQTLMVSPVSASGPAEIDLSDRQRRHDDANRHPAMVWARQWQRRPSEWTADLHVRRHGDASREQHRS